LGAVSRRRPLEALLLDAQPTDGWSAYLDQAGEDRAHPHSWSGHARSI